MASIKHAPEVPEPRVGIVFALVPAMGAALERVVGIVKSPICSRQSVIRKVESLTSQSIRLIMICMRTTIDLPEELLEEARTALGFKSKTDTVIMALRELVRRRRLDELKALMGRVQLQVDVPASRRRPRRAR